MAHGRLLPFASARPRVRPTPAEQLRRVVGRMSDDIQILVGDQDDSLATLLQLARLLHTVATPARRRLARATARHRVATLAHAQGR